MDHVAWRDWQEFPRASALLHFPADWDFNSVQETVTWTSSPLARCDGCGGEHSRVKGLRLSETQEDTSWVFRMLSPPPPPNQRNDYRERHHSTCSGTLKGTYLKGDREL